MDDPNPGYEEPSREGSWETSRNHEADRVAVRSTSAYTLPFDHITIDYEERIETAVSVSEPKTAFGETVLKVALKYTSETIHTTVRTCVLRDTAQVATDVKIDDQPMFGEEWR